MNKVLTRFIRCWIALAILVNIIAVAGIFLAAHSLSAGSAASPRSTVR
jgi:hypothetical protein